MPDGKTAVLELVIESDRLAVLNEEVLCASRIVHNLERGALSFNRPQLIVFGVPKQEIGLNPAQLDSAPH